MLNESWPRSLYAICIISSYCFPGLLMAVNPHFDGSESQVKINKHFTSHEKMDDVTLIHDRPHRTKAYSDQFSQPNSHSNYYIFFHDPPRPHNEDSAMFHTLPGYTGPPPHDNLILNQVLSIPTPQSLLNK